MKDHLTPEQRRMLRDAVTKGKTESLSPRDKPQRAKRRFGLGRPDGAGVARDYFCTACYAERQDDACPRCDHGQTNVKMFCKRCLRVHLSQDKCAAWVPPRDLD
jgi:hypothetical protein